MRLAIALLVAACGGKTDVGPTSSPESSPQPSDAPTLAPVACQQLAFAESTPVPEASGAAWMTVDGAIALVVISDSGNDGEYAIVDPETGATRERGKLPLGSGASDDLEGVAMLGDTLVAVTSSGWIRTWKRADHGFSLVDGPYPLAPRSGDHMVCRSGEQTNCARNYEGLCLAPDRRGARCLGFVASKADGALYCVVERSGRLAVEQAGAIHIARGGAIADCAYSDDGALYVGSNLFDLSRVYRVAGWQDPARARVEEIAKLGVGFPETLAVRGDVFYRMSDTGGAPSLMAKYRCAR